jgi:hypothetical protein
MFVFGIRVKTGHRQVRPAKWTYSDGRFTMFNSCKNSVLYDCLAEPFSDTCFCTYRGVS